MARIAHIAPGFYRVPLPTVLTDSTHGEMRAFELCTVRLRDGDGAEGVGYTFTVGRNGGAIADILAREVPEILAGEDADLIEHLWQKLWWALHYGGRGGPTVLAISAVDMALWDLKAKRAHTPLWRLLGGYDRGRAGAQAQGQGRGQAAYARGDLFVKRRKLMEDWAAYLTKPAGEVVALPAPRAEGAVA